MRKRYRFGHVCVEVNMPDDMKSPENMKLFEVPCVQAEALEGAELADVTECTEAAIDKVCNLEFSDDLKAIEQKVRAKYADGKEIGRPNMQILVTPKVECRFLRFEGAPFAYAVHVEESQQLTSVWVSRDVADMLQYDTIFGSLLGLEKIILRKQSLVLHSAYMCRDGKAVLFSAPSETGKSTQADLWEKYRGTRTINGDRSMLVREKDGWYAHGWPICGSSEICHNEAYPIQAIVMLYQAKENSIRRLKGMGAMKKLLSQITINMWNAEFQNQAMDLIQQVMMEVPVYELGCNISEDAVKCLESVL